MHIARSLDTVSIIEVPFKYGQCEQKTVSECNLKLHKAIWHTEVDPELEYGYITNMLSKGAKYNFLCLICEKLVYYRVKHLQ